MEPCCVCGSEGAVSFLGHTFCVVHGTEAVAAIDRLTKRLKPSERFVKIQDFVNRTTENR